MLLTVVVAQNPDNQNIHGYQQTHPSFGTLTPRNVLGDNDTLITSFTATKLGMVKIDSKQPILGATPKFTSESGVTVQLTFAAGSYTGTSVEFAASVKAHDGGTFNMMADTEAIIEEEG